MAAAMITAVALVVVLSVAAAHHIGVTGQRSGSQRFCRLVRVTGHAAIQLYARRCHRRLSAAANAAAVKARGNFEITMNWKNGKLTEANIHSLSGKSCTLRARQAFTVKSNGRTIATSTPVRSNGKEYFQATFETQKDRTYLITQ